MAGLSEDRAVALAQGPGENAAIARLARAASIEASTKNVAEIGAYATWLAPGTEVYVPCLPATPYHHILSVAKRLREIGMNPVPHIAARRLATVAAAGECMTRLREEAGVKRVLLIAGDNEAAAGPFASSVAVLETGLLQSCGITSVGVAGYPEGHPRIATEALGEALQRKLNYAATHGLELFMVSQFCFDGERVLEWLEALRARGVTLPVRVGVAGPTSIRTLLNYGIRCGIGHSLRALVGAQPVSMPRLLASRGPETVVRRIAPEAARLGIAGLHVFPFGGFVRSARWMRDVAAGRFQVGTPGAGFDLQDASEA